VILVHGGMCTAACWDPLMPHLAIPVIAVDLPGRGSRPADLATVTLDDCVQAVIDSADQAGFDRFVLVGHSLVPLLCPQFSSIADETTTTKHSLASHQHASAARLAVANPPC
jgi:pimeloyl-ACP methyl ester carboxylesterase